MQREPRVAALRQVDLSHAVARRRVEPARLDGAEGALAELVDEEDGAGVRAGAAAVCPGRP